MIRLEKVFRNPKLREPDVFTRIHLEIDGDEERPGQFWVDPFPAFDAQHLGDFQKLHARVHHHLLDTRGSDLGFELIEDDVMNHEVKAIRRFRRGAQVGIKHRRARFIEWSNR